MHEAVDKERPFGRSEPLVVRSKGCSPRDAGSHATVMVAL